MAGRERRQTPDRPHAAARTDLPHTHRHAAGGLRRHAAWHAARRGRGPREGPDRRIRPDGRREHHGARLFRWHDQEDLPGHGDDPQSAHPCARRAFRIGRPGVEREHQRHPRRLRAHRRHRGHLLACDGARGTHVHPCGRGQPRPGRGRGHGGAGRRRRGPRRALPAACGRPPWRRAAARGPDGSLSCAVPQTPAGEVRR